MNDGTPAPASPRDGRAPMERALDALDGLSVGDAFGEQFFGFPEEVTEQIASRRLPDGLWPWTDDTTMALSIVAVLWRQPGIDRDTLAAAFGEAYRRDPHRGYGPTMHRLLCEYHAGSEWQRLAAQPFGGQGSFGNGAAMRVAPVGAFFAGDLERVAMEATASAEITHAHPDGIAGAVAVAVATAVAVASPVLGAGDLIGQVIEHTPEGAVRRGLRRALELPAATAPTDAGAVLGNGSEVSAQDTVPLCVWIAARDIDDYESALWNTVSCLGDRDTTCAIVGGILGARLTASAVPAAWKRHREPLPPWVGRPHATVS